MHRRPRILIADDDRALVDTIREALEDDFIVETAADGSEALTKAGKVRPDLVMLDVEMPKMDGYQSCRAMREQLDMAAIPIIMLTGRNEAEDAQRAFEAGATDYLTKPFSIAQLRARAETCLLRGSADN